MTRTVLLQSILENAKAVQTEFNSEYLCASHIVVAVADFCRTTYTGFSLSDTTYYPSRFEEERLRYVFSRESKLAAYFRNCLSRNARNGVQEEKFEISRCEHIAASRGAEVLPSDVVFLCALKELPKPYKAAIRSITSDDAILALLQETDANIYDYVIDKLDSVLQVLKKKSDEAVAIRDWKPAAKFAEPDALAAMFFEKIEKKTLGNVITLRFPKFFGATDLKVSIHQAGGIYYVHDNGCAIKHLAKQIKDELKCGRVLKKVCHSCWIHNGKITGSFTNASRFLYYLQKLVFVAQADLYYTKAEQALYPKEKDYVFVAADKADSIDEGALLEELKNGIHFCYDENEGLYYWLDTRYSLFSGKASFLVETLENGLIRTSDRRKGKIEGEIFESFYWDNDDIGRYSKFISKIAARFGGEFDGKDVYLTDKNFVRATMKFFNLAVLLSELGHDIALPKIRQKG